MGKKKQARQEKKAKHTTPRAATSSGWGVPLLIVGGLLLVGVVSMVVYVQANKDHFIKLSVLSTCEKVRKELDQNQAGFTRFDNSRMQLLVQNIKHMADQGKTLEPKLGGHFMFILKVLEEIIQAGNLQPNELEKLEMLVNQAKHMVQEKKTK